MFPLCFDINREDNLYPNHNQKKKQYSAASYAEIIYTQPYLRQKLNRCAVFNRGVNFFNFLVVDSYAALGPIG